VRDIYNNWNKNEFNTQYSSIGEHNLTSGDVEMGVNSGAFWNGVPVVRIGMRTFAYDIIVSYLFGIYEAILEFNFWS
jgi:hypothetical protein